MLRVIYDDTSRSPRYREVGRPAAFGEGFHGEELEDAQPFHWTGRQAVLDLTPAADGADRTAAVLLRSTVEAPAERFLEMEVFSPFFDLSQTATVDAGEASAVLALVHGWAPVSVALPASATAATLRVSKLLPAARHPGDSRDLGVGVRGPRVHTARSRHEAIERQHANAVLNWGEMLAGRSDLRSTPPVLGIDLHGVCNVKPPCVYCEWDEAKTLEGDAAETPFTRATLEEWGDLFDHATHLINCSIGEPFMMKETLDDLLDAFGEQGKTLEMTTNGQILTDKNIEKLLGRKIHLYVSLDAGTAETYAKLRNDSFDRILANLRRLIDAKGGRAGFPKVHLVFMPMRVNVHELEDFVRLCALLEADRMVLRPLNYTESSALDWVRNGHHFRYVDELLPWSELVRVSGRAAELARRHGVQLADQLGFGGDLAEEFPEELAEGRREVDPPDRVPTAMDGAPKGSADAEVRPAAGQGQTPPLSLGEERLPRCIEPWKSLYILRRGVLPCCYGGAPIAPMEEYRRAWGSPRLQGIRSELAAGRFHDYCLRSDSCPVVRRAVEDGSVGRGARALLAARSSWRRLDRLALGLPGRILRPILAPAKAPLGRLIRRLGRLLGD